MHKIKPPVFFKLPIFLGLLVTAVLGLSSSASAQCTTVNLLNPSGTPRTSYELFSPNNTLCRFGGNLNAVRGIVSCLSANVAITSANQSSYESLLGRIEAKLPLTNPEITLITNTVNHAVISNVATAQSIEIIFLNTSELVQYVTSNYPLVGVGRGTYRKVHGASLDRIAFTPINRTGFFTANVMTEVLTSSQFLTITGYNRTNDFSRFVIFRVVPATVVNNFAPFTVCRNPDSYSFSDFLHRQAESISGMPSFSSQRFIHVD